MVFEFADTFTHMVIFMSTAVFKPQGKRRLSNTVQDINVTKQKSEEIGDDSFTHLEDMQLTLTSPRHYLRRRALVQEELQNDVNSSAVIRSANVSVSTQLP